MELILERNDINISFRDLPYSELTMCCFAVPIQLLYMAKKVTFVNKKQRIILKDRYNETT